MLRVHAESKFIVFDAELRKWFDAFGCCYNFVIALNFLVLALAIARRLTEIVILPRPWTMLHLNGCGRCEFKFVLELIHTQRKQKRMLRAEVKLVKMIVCR
jgi:hypothetical protein